MSEPHTLGVFAKQPKAGLVKSRLARETSPEWAAQVAEAFLLDWLAKLKGFPARRVLVYAPPEAESYFAGLAEKAFEIEPQTLGDLGMRMENFLKRRLAAGDEKVVIIGTDSPTLPLDYLHRAFAELAKADVVVGPARDGGYYLIGCARQVPNVFAGIHWGGATVFTETLDRLRESRSRFVVLSPWYDVDTLEDWKALCEEVRSQRLAGEYPRLSHTERLIQNL